MGQSSELGTSEVVEQCFLDYWTGMGHSSGAGIGSDGPSAAAYWVGECVVDLEKWSRSPFAGRDMRNYMAENGQ